MLTPTSTPEHPSENTTNTQKENLSVSQDESLPSTTRAYDNDSEPVHVAAPSDPPNNIVLVKQLVVDSVLVFHRLS